MRYRLEDCLLNAADNPSGWDIPGLLRDASDTIMDIRKTLDEIITKSEIVTDKARASYELLTERRKSCELLP